VDEILTMDRGGNFYYHQNALWSVEAVTDVAGNVVERYAYDAYGLPAIFNGAGAPVAPNPWGTSHSAIGNPWMFTGRQFDEETGIYFYRARYYDPVKGRFLQRDPLGYVDGMNLYEYVQSRPTYTMDPEGMQTLSIQNEESAVRNGADNGLIIDWALSQPARSNGHIVQFMTREWSIRNCATGKEIYILRGNRFWEAWPVAAGTRKPPAKRGAADDDWVFNNEGAGTCGEVTITGKARFYERLPRLPGGFVPNNKDPQCSAGELPCAPDSVIPALWKQRFNDPAAPGSNIVERELKFKWNCCPSNERKTEILSKKP